MITIYLDGRKYTSIDKFQIRTQVLGARCRARDLFRQGQLTVIDDQPTIRKMRILCQISISIPKLREDQSIGRTS